MNRKWFIIITIASLAVSFQAEGQETPQAFWVYFRDKGPHQNWRSKARSSLSERSLARRAKIKGRSGLVDLKDLPLHRPYVTAVESAVTRVRHESKWMNALSVEANIEQKSLLAALPFVKAVIPVKAFKRLSYPASVHRWTGQSETSGIDYGDCEEQLTQIKVNYLHRLGFTGRGVLVCLLDTGFYKEHECLRDLDLIAERDFVFFDEDTQRDPDDPNDFSDSHGTAVWSALGGYADGAQIGPAFGASFLLAKTEDLRYELPVEEDNWVAAVEWADSAGADVVSSSLSYTTFQDGSGYSFEDLDGNTAVTTLAADRAAELGIAVVISAGNYRTNSWGHIGTPADGDSVISVGAVDVNGNLASFSSPGPTADGRTKPEVCARGVSTHAAHNFSPWAYQTTSGTSLSTPLVAGAAALLLEIHPDWTGMDVRTSLMETGDRSGSPDNDFGWGIIDAFRASGVQAPMLLLAGVDIDDDEAGESSGNGNRYPEPGERVELRVAMTNDGSLSTGQLHCSLSTGETLIDIVDGEIDVSSIAPGDTTTSQEAFVVDLEQSLPAFSPISFTLLVLDTSGDTLLSEDLSIMPVETALLTGSVVESGIGSAIGDCIVSVVRTEEDTRPVVEFLCGSDGLFAEWLTPGSYAVQSKKDGYISPDALTVELYDSTYIEVQLARPELSLQLDTLVVSAGLDTSFNLHLDLWNTGTGTLQISIQPSAVETTESRSVETWAILRSDPIEGSGLDLLTVRGLVSPSEIAIRVASTSSWIPGNGKKLVVGLETDTILYNGLPAAGLLSDFKIEWSSNASLYKVYSDTWQFSSSVETDSVSETLTARIPREDLVLDLLPNIRLAVQIEDWSIPDTVMIVDTVPNDGGTYPITWPLLSPRWMELESTSISIPQGESGLLPISFSSMGIDPGRYSAELLIQGGLQEMIRLPVRFSVADSNGQVPELPSELVLGLPYPNPATESFSLLLGLPTASDVELFLTDLSGRLVQEWSVGGLPPGTTLIPDLEIDAEVPRGSYWLHVSSNGTTKTGHIMVRQ